MKSVETTAKTREEAIEKALKELRAERHEVEVEILDGGSRGLFGLGARDVCVRVTVDRDDEEEERRPARSGGRGSSRGGGGRPGRGSRRDGDSRGQDRDRRERPTDSRGSTSDDSRSSSRGGGDRRSKPRPERRRDDGGRRNDGDRDDGRRDDGRRDDGRRDDGRRDDGRRDDGRRDGRRNENRGPRPSEIEQTAKELEEVEVEPLTEQEQGEAAALLTELVTKMGIEAKVTPGTTEEGIFKLNIESPDSAILIGRKGKNREALQYLINRMLCGGEVPSSPDRIIVDVESYLDRRRETLQDMARNLARKARETGRNVRVRPLSPQERRIVHLTLQDDPDVRTFSVGNSVNRCVIIAPEGGEEPPSRPRRSGGGGRRRGGRGGSRSGESRSSGPEQGES